MKQVSIDLYSALVNNSQDAISDLFKMFSKRMSLYEDFSAIEEVYDVAKTLWLFMIKRKFSKDESNIKWTERCLYFLTRAYSLSNDNVRTKSCLMMLSSLLNRQFNYLDKIFDCSMSPDRYLRPCTTIKAQEKFDQYLTLRLFLNDKIERIYCDNQLIDLEIVERHQKGMQNLMNKALPNEGKTIDDFNIDSGSDILERLYNVLSLKYNKLQRRKTELLFSHNPQFVFQAKHAEYYNFNEVSLISQDLTAIVCFSSQESTLINIVGVNTSIIPEDFSWDEVYRELDLENMTVHYAPALFTGKSKSAMLPNEPSSCDIVFEGEKILMLRFSGLDEQGYLYYLTLS